MAYIIYYHKGEEMGRVPLEGPVLVGRSPECSVSIRDILLSRVHCQIEPGDDGGWTLKDTGSKNGTRVDGQLISRHVLRDGDVVQMGKSAVRFCAGAFVPGKKPKPPTVQRPSDPFEALSGTVSAFE
jgi:pSer/pThr/pTyr-binding forkhead associated (FHA) protein